MITAEQQIINLHTNLRFDILTCLRFYFQWLSNMLGIPFCFKLFVVLRCGPWVSIPCLETTTFDQFLCVLKYFWAICVTDIVEMEYRLIIHNHTLQRLAVHLV